MRLILCLYLLVLALPARALDDVQTGAARAVITRQIEAFRRNDSAAAYAQAAPQIQNLFPSPDRFLAMVEQGYKPVLRPRSYAFGLSEEAGEDELAQAVSLQDEDGEDWDALYALQKQADGQWRITGCTLRRATGSRV